MKRFISIVILASYVSAAAAETDIQSANNLAPYCLTTTGDYFEGVCTGIVQGLYAALTAAKIVCPPDGVTIGQMSKVAGLYAQKHPDITHKHMTIVASQALAEAWPCQTQNRQSSWH